MPLPRRQRVAAYAVIIRDEQILLARLAERISASELWTLPGGGIDHGEDPRDAVVREIREETGLDAVVGEQARVYSAHMPHARRDGRRSDYHALRIVYDAWVPPDAPAPRVVEVDGSTVDAAWHPLAGVLDGTVPTVPMVSQAVEDWSPFRLQRLGAYALVRRETRSCWCASRPRASTPARGACPAAASTTASGRQRPWCARSRRSAASGRGRRPAARPRPALQRHGAVRAVRGLPRRLAGVRGDRVRRAAPRVVEVDGTTDAVAWVPSPR